MSILQNDGGVNRQATSRTQSAPDGIPITVKNKTSGFFMPRTLTYYRRVEGSRHFLRKPPAITNDAAALAEAERLGAERVRIVDSETGIEYTCITPIIHDFGFTINRGWGEQIALPFAYWIKCAPGGMITQPTLPKQTQPQLKAIQGTLFDFSEQRRGGAY